MKLVLFDHQNTINIILTTIIVVTIFYSDSLEQKISEIQSDYIIDTNTLNNSFITLDIDLYIEDHEAYQKIKNDLKIQMNRFNEKYVRKESEIWINKLLQKWIDRTIYVLTFMLILFNTLVSLRNYRSSWDV